MTVIEKLHRIRRNLTSYSYEEVVFMLDDILPRVPIEHWSFKNERYELRQHDRGGKNYLYRARVNKSTGVWEMVSDISAIPAEKVHIIKQFGRVNKPHESMFYGSTEIQTACLETFSKGESFETVKAKGGVNLTVGEWEILSPLDLARIPYSIAQLRRFSEELKIIDPKSISFESIQRKNDRFKLHFNEDEYQIYLFFADEFAKTDTADPKEYMLTNYFADRVFNRLKGFRINPPIDGIVYPSVCSAYQTDNIVLPLNVAKDKLKFRGAVHIWYPYFKETDAIQFIPLSQNKKANDAGEILWVSK